MAYYVRPDREPGRYIRTNVPDGHYLVHSAKGSEWTKGHKYIDKRWIEGAWHYLYEIPKEYAEKAGNAVKETAQKATSAAKETVKKATDTVKETTQKTQKAAKDFKEYSKNVDSKKARAQSAQQNFQKEAQKSEQAYLREKQKQEDLAKKQNDALKTSMGSKKVYDSLHDKYEQEQNNAEAHLEALRDKIHNGGVVNQKEWQDAYDRIDAAKDKLSDLEKNQKKYQEELHTENQKAHAQLEKSQEKSELYGRRAEDYNKLGDVYSKKEEEAAKEQETAKYKASKALNDILDGATGITAQGAQWLKNQMEAGNKFAINTLAAIEEKGMSAVTKGNAFLKNLLKGKSSQTALPARSSSGRKLNGTGNKAERREVVGGGPVSNNDYSNRPKKRR